MRQAGHLVDLIIRVMALGLVIRMVLGWIAPAGIALRPAALFLDRVYEPILRPIRRVVRPVRIGSAPQTVLDLSGLVFLVALWLFIHPFLLWLVGAR